MPAPRPDILEIGYVGFFKRLIPERTIFVAVEAAAGEDAFADAIFEHRGSSTLAAALADPGIRAVVVRVHHHPGRAYRRLFRLLRRPARAPSGFWPGRRTAGPAGRPLAVLDFEDEAFVHPELHPLLRAATHVFKRELPVDRWRLLQLPFGVARDEAAHRRDGDAERVLEKIRPLPLGLPLDERRFMIPPDPVPKAYDLFFAGRLDASSWPRRQGRGEIETLAARGLAIDVLAAPLAPQEFYRRCAAAWLTWSPQGFGWDCFRHYEAAACRSVPVINYPTVERHQGLADGVHAVFYDPRPGGLADAVETALQDRPRLTRMGEAGHAHVLEHHTPEAIARRILGEFGLDP